MDDNNFATSTDSSEQDPHFATEAPEQPSAPAREADVPEAAPAVVAEDKPVKAEKPEAPKTTREALEQAVKAAQDKAEGKEPAAPVAQDPTKPVIPAAPGPKDFKAPQSWKADTREKFGALPDDVKQEVLRRENEISTTLAKTAQERKIAQEFITVASPFAHTYQAMGIDPVRAAQQFFQADHLMRTGQASQKAGLMAKLIKDYGVDLAALDSALAGIAPPPAQAATATDPALLERLQRMEQFAQNQQQQVHRQAQESVNKDIETFANDSKNEFFNDVAPHMVALLQGGTAKTLQEAYDQACYANQSVRKVLMQRDQANKQRLAASSASLPNKGPRNVNQPAQRHKSTREALEAAFAEAERTRV